MLKSNDNFSLNVAVAHKFHTCTRTPIGVVVHFNCCSFYFPNCNGIPFSYPQSTSSLYDNIDDESVHTHSSQSLTHSSHSLSSRSDDDRYDVYGSPHKTIGAGPRPMDIIGQEDAPVVASKVSRRNALWDTWS